MPVENPAAVASSQDLHAWEAGGAASAEALSAWVGARLAAHEAALAALLAVEGERTPENSLRLYDAAIEHLNLAGAQAGVLNSVAADKAVRDQAQQEAQRVAQAGSALEPESRGLRGTGRHRPRRRQPGYKAFRRAHPARLPPGRRGQGPGHPRTACNRSTRRPRAFRSSSAATSRRAAKTIEAPAAELDGLPADYIARHPAGRRRPRDPHHRPARHAAGDDLCRECRACASACSWPTTPAPILPTGRFFSTCWPRGRRLPRSSASAAGPIWPPPTR